MIRSILQHDNFIMFVVKKMKGLNTFML